MLHCTEPYIIILPLFQYLLNNVEGDIIYKIIIIEVVKKTCSDFRADIVSTLLLTLKALSKIVADDIFFFHIFQ